ncbi:group-specific protein [Paenibacillus oleatilyticus]|uniref:group-specific protein n=1 Tax=Paenibacillus oleatilyticus TaxID=2594886 RepID=UPI001C1FAF8E|nr:group-specific protein [Paenibacillus oleatilyticus]MBU7320311.1 group-specific protein [Paenibacillus oleatilyticus]
MLNVQVDRDEVMKLCREKIDELVKEIDAEYVFWDTAELKKRTCMSWNTIQDAFFFDPRFPKRKVGSKWYFPVRDTRAFLEKWLYEQTK